MVLSAQYQFLTIVSDGANWVVTSGGATSTIPSGAIIYANMIACPTGWTEVTAARGRYVVGLPASGTLAGTDGTALSNLEDRSVGQHNHGINDPGHVHTTIMSTGTVYYSNGGNGMHQTNYSNSNANTTGVTIQNAGSTTGTNAPYVQYLVCQKQ